MGDLNLIDGLDATVVRCEDNIEVAVSGEIDIVNVDRFRRALVRAVLEAPGAVHLDLSGVRFVGSEGIRTLIQVRKLADSKNVTFQIVKASRRVECVLDLMGLSGYFE